MFDSLSDRLGRTLRNITGRGRLTDDNIKDTLRDIRNSLLEADVSLDIVKDFTGHIRERAIGHEVSKSLNPGQALVKIVQSELVKLMGETNETLNLSTQPPAVILMAGLQGSGKTTTVAKLARLLKEQHKKSVLVVSCDIYRPAAIEQLKTLAGEIEVDFFPSHSGENPVTIAKNAIAHAKTQFKDVVIVDTAGRLHVDEDMMEEIKQIHAHINPIETLFVVDSMTGQDAAKSAKAFHAALPLTGVILTKADGDARGGAALSIRMITGKPIKFIGMGEKTDALEAFHPERIASRILGMGDMLSLVEEAERKIDKVKAEKLAKKISKGKGFDLEDFRDQLKQLTSMGGLSKLMEKLPMGANLPPEARQKMEGEKTFKKLECIIGSMTIKERRNPDLINGSRKRRIAGGSGTDIQDINRLLKQFDQMQKMMKKFSKPGKMKNMLRNMPGMMQGGGMGGIF